MFIIVDLPEPEGPITATKSPAAIVRSTPRKAWNAPSPEPNVLVMPRSSISAESIAPCTPASRRRRSLRTGRELARDHGFALLEVAADDFGLHAVRVASLHRDAFRLAVRTEHEDVLHAAA